MVKNIFIAFSILLSISLMFFISLSNGIRLGDFSYENISIKGLYLKYDEKFIIETQNVIIYNSTRTKSTQFRIKFTVERFFKKYFIHVENFLLKDPFLKISGYIVVDPKNIDLDSISNLYINSSSIQFNRHLKPVKAEKCFVKYKDNNFYFSFLKPKYGSVSLKGSTVSIVDFEHVVLNLQSNDKLNSEILELLSNYKVEVPVQQIDGTNSIKVNIKIPFDIKKDMDIHSHIDLENGKILLYDIPLYVDNLKLDLNNNILKGSGKLLKKHAGKEDLLYNVDKEFTIDFRKKRVDGNFTIEDGLFKNLFTTDTKGKFSIDFDKKFDADITLQPNSFLMLKDELLKLKHFKTHYKNSSETFTSTIQLQHLISHLNMDINDTFDLDKLRSKGKLNLDFEDKNSTLHIENANYKSFFNDKFHLIFSDNNTTLRYKKMKIDSTTLKGEFVNDTLSGELYDVNITKEKPLAYFHKVDFTIKGKKDIYLSTPTIVLSELQLPVKVGDIDVHIKNSKAMYSSTIDGQYNLQGQFDLDKRDIKGVLNYKNELLDFKGNFLEDKILHVPKMGINYIQKENGTFKLDITQPKTLKEFFPYLLFHKNSSVKLKRETEDSPILVNLKDIDFDILAFEKKKQELGTLGTPSKNNANINWKNGAFIIGEYKLPFKNSNLKLSSGTVSGHIEAEDNSSINIKQDIHELVIVSNNLQSQYVNTIFQKPYFEDGNFEIFLTRKNVDTFEGIVKIKEVTFKELQFIDNLLLFVNSTPAFINPFLALPTFLRFGMSGFKLDGYHVIDGKFNFIYHRNKDILELNNILTKGNINNFQGNMSVNLQNKSVNGKLDVIFLKDFATVLRNIPLVDKITLNKEGNIALPIDISGTLENPSFSINNK